MACVYFIINSLYYFWKLKVFAYLQEYECDRFRFLSISLSACSSLEKRKVEQKLQFSFNEKSNELMRNQTQT